MAADKPLHSVYVLVGSEPVRRRYLLRRLKAISNSWHEASADEVSPDDVLSADLLTSPDNPSLTILVDYASWSSAQRKRFAALIMENNLPAGLHVAVCCNRLGPKDPLRAAVSKEALIALESPRPGSYPSWAARHVKLLGASLTQDAAQELVERTGENTERIATEIEKLAGACDGEPIDSDMVQALVAPSTSVQGWAWADAVVAGDDRAAARVLAEAEASELAPQMLLAVLRGRLNAAAWHAAGLSQQDAQVKDYPWKLAGQLAKRLGPDLLHRQLTAVGALEMQMRGIAPPLQGNPHAQAWIQLASFRLPR